MKMLICLMLLGVSTMASASSGTVECDLRSELYSHLTNKNELFVDLISFDLEGTQDKSFKLQTGEVIKIKYSDFGSFSPGYHPLFILELKRGSIYTTNSTVSSEEDLNKVILHVNLKSSDMSTNVSISNCAIKKTAQPDPFQCAPTQKLCNDSFTGEPYCAAKCSPGGWW